MPTPGGDKPASGADQPLRRGAELATAGPGSENPAWQPAGSEAPAWQPPAYNPQQYRSTIAGAPRVTRSTAGRPGLQPAGVRAAGYGTAAGHGAPQQYGQQYPAPGQYARAVPAARAAGSVLRRVSRASTGYIPPGAEEGAKTSGRAIGAILGGLGAAARRAVGAGLQRRLFVTTKLDVNKAQQGCAATSPTSPMATARRTSRTSCNNGANPTVKKGHLQLRGQHRRHQASGDGDVPGRQGHVRGRPAWGRGAASSDNRGPRSSCSRDSRLRGRRTGSPSGWVAPGRHCCCTISADHAMWHAVAPSLTQTFTVVLPTCPAMATPNRRLGASLATLQAGVGSASGHSHGGVGFPDFRCAGMTAARGWPTEWHSTTRSACSVSRSSTSCPPPRCTTGPIVSSGSGYRHWFFLIQPAPFPETMIGHDPDGFFEAPDEDDDFRPGSA